MAMASNIEDALTSHDLRSLRLGSFCAEPVTKAVHQFAAAHLTPYYINSYWATEHGGIVWSRCHDSPLQLRADTRTWPLPWIHGDVVTRVSTAAGVANGGSSGEARDGCTPSLIPQRAADGVQGEVVVCRRYPYMALTVWSSSDYGSPGWCGDVTRWRSYFVDQVGYVQGDAAVRNQDGSFIFRGRSDEVINVGGHRIGTEEIENALLVVRAPASKESSLLLE